jgi:hypothetical protein
MGRALSFSKTACADLINKLLWTAATLMYDEPTIIRKLLDRFRTRSEDGLMLARAA